MNFKKAPLQIVLSIKRRLEKSNPGAVLDESSVKLVPIPKTQFDATIFCFELKGKHRLIAEACADRADLPHIYVGKTVDPTAKGSAAALVWVITHLGYRILADPQFSRGNIIRVNGFAHA